MSQKKSTTTGTRKTKLIQPTPPGDKNPPRVKVETAAPEAPKPGGN